MKTTRLDYVIMGIATLSLGAIAIYIYPRLPETIPVRWNFRSEAEGFGPRWTILLMGALPLALYILMRILPQIDPRKEAYAVHRRAYEVLTVGLSLAFVPIAWIVAVAALGAAIDVGILIRLVVGLLFMGIGTILGKFRPNYFVGIRTPWTLADPDVWRKTHRRGAWVFITMGLALIVSILVPHSALAAALVICVTLGGAVYLFAYSYTEFRRSRKNPT